MNPLEAALRQACKEMGADPDCPVTGGWRNFLKIGHPIAEAFVNALPPDLADAVRPYLHQPKD